MNSILAICLGLLGFFVFMQVYLLVLGVSRLIKVPLRAALPAPVLRSAMGRSTAILDTAAPQLEQLGFRYMHSLRTRSPIAAEGMPFSFCDVYFHAQHGVHAQVTPAAVPTLHKLCDITLMNSFTDGSRLFTVDGAAHLLAPFPANVTVVDARAGNLADQLARHLAVLTPLFTEPLAPSDFLDESMRFARDVLGILAAEKQLYRRGGDDDDPVFGLRPLAALRLAGRQYVGALRTPASRPALEAPAFGDAVNAAQRAAFVRTLCTLRALDAPAWFRRTAFALSAALFMAIGAWLWGFGGALTIIAVLALHEAGHWAAMKLSGFRDVQVFFVPGMGAATSGEKHEAHPFIHLLVYLAGPMPGLLVALALLAWVAGGPAHQDAAWYPALLAGAFAALAINAFNLLPVLPLDGGRVVEMFLVGRLPWLRFVFAVASGLMFLGAGYYLDGTALYVIAIAMLFGSYHHFQVAQAAARLLKKGKGDASKSSYASAAGKLYDFLARPEFAGWTYQTRMQVGLALLPRFRGRPPRLAESGAALAIYAACALLPLAATAALVTLAPAQMSASFQQVAATLSGAPASRGPVVSKAAEEAAWELEEGRRRARREADIAAATEPRARIAQLLEAIADADEHDETEDAIRFARLLYAATDPEGSRERAHAAMLLADSLAEREPPLPSQAAAQAATQADTQADTQAQAMAEIDNLQREADFILRARLADKPEPDDALLLGQLIQTRSYMLPLEQRLGAQEEVAGLYAARLAPVHPALATAHRDLAHALHRAGRRADAERAMRAMMAALATPPDPQALMLKQEMAWMLLAYGKVDEAEQLVLTQLSAVDQNGKALRIVDRPGLQWMIARRKGDWEAARRHAQEAQQMRSARAENGLPSWLSVWLLRPALSDPQAVLMAIEAERGLGRQDAATKLVSTALKPVRPGAAPRECRMGSANSAWRSSFDQALLSIELRELHCTPRPLSPSTAPAAAPSVPSATAAAPPVPGAPA